MMHADRQVTELIEKPGNLLQLLGASAPQTASFFLLYILFNGLVRKPLGLVRPWALALHAARWGLTATRAARQRLWQNQVLPFGWQVSCQPVSSLSTTMLSRQLLLAQQLAARGLIINALPL